MTQMIDVDVSGGPVLFTETTHFPGFETAHNIFINEDTGYAYVVGSKLCEGGLYIVDIANPLSPTFVACFSEDGYVHDVQCKWKTTSNFLKKKLLSLVMSRNLLRRRCYLQRSRCHIQRA